jgi:hypothetical protein
MGKLPQLNWYDACAVWLGLAGVLLTVASVALPWRAVNVGLGIVAMLILATSITAAAFGSDYPIFVLQMAFPFVAVSTGWVAWLILAARRQ